jgi:hypothetical protein
LAAKISIESDDAFDQEEALMTFETLDGKKIEIPSRAAQSVDTAMGDQDSLLPKVRALIRPLYGEAGTESLISSFRELHAAAKLPDIAAQRH